MVKHYVDAFSIKVTSCRTAGRNLSGGKSAEGGFGKMACK